MIRRRTYLGDPRLKSKNIEIVDVKDKKLVKVIEDMVDTMHKIDLIGIAAPQIGENYQVFITEPRKTKSRPIDQADELRVYINPKIIYYSEEKVVLYEGCGSVPGNIFGPVKRAKVITVEASDQKGKKFQLKCDGLLAIVIQHEYDHLQGIEFVEKVLDYKKLLSRKYYYKNIKYSPAQIKASLITIKEVKFLDGLK